MNWSLELNFIMQIVFVTEYVSNLSTGCKDSTGSGSCSTSYCTGYKTNQTTFTGCCTYTRANFTKSCGIEFCQLGQELSTTSFPSIFSSCLRAFCSALTSTPWSVTFTL